MKDHDESSDRPDPQKEPSSPSEGQGCSSRSIDEAVSRGIRDFTESLPGRIAALHHPR